MSDRSPASVPLVPLPSQAPLSLQIEALRDEAENQGLGMLAHLLDCALIEAKHQADQRRREARDRDADPGDLWRPEP